MDPILAAIANHKAAHAIYSATIDRYEAIADLEGNDPRLLQAERDTDAAGDVETMVAWALANVPPSTKDGTLDLLDYVTTRRGWPGDSWHTGLLENRASAINRFFGRSQ